ncbi:MAG: hypothetical protein JWN01_1229 [Patescibacteria group bacterium]|nr:hypothetical protein [Patescibacteria group bacterium]
MAKTTQGTKADNLSRLAAAGFNVPKFYVVPPTATARTAGAAFVDWSHTHGVKSVAIRSSGTIEDGKDQSFAGQFTTLLGVSGADQFTTGIDKVLSSRAHAAYSKARGSVYAIVQEYIEPDIAGVIFSVNPANGNQEFVINVAAGVGTAVVEGREAQQYFVDRLDWSDVTKVTHGERELLAQAQIKQLCQIATQAEVLFGTLQDIEWAIKDDTVYVLQSRPVTSVNHLRLWDSSNISESFPGVVLPLTFSIAKRGYQLAYKAQAYAAGLSWYELEADHRTFDGMIGIFNGRMYYNLLHWYRFIALFPGSSNNQKYLDDQIATQGEGIRQAATARSLRFRLKFYLRILYRAVFFRYELRRFYRRFQQFEDDMRALPGVGDSQVLLRRYTHIEQTIVPHFGRTVDNDFFVMIYHGWLKRLLSEVIPDNTSIIGSLNGVVSAEQATSLYDLAEQLRADQPARKLLVAGDYAALDKHLAGGPLEAAITRYIETFGHRFAGDQKIEVENPTLQEHGVYKLMRAYVQLSNSELTSRMTESRAKSSQVELKIKTRLGPLRRLMYVALLSRLKHHLRLREKNRLLRGKAYNYMRELFPKLGRALADEGVLEAGNDIFYLQIEEIYDLVQGSLITNDLAKRIKRRTEAYRGFADMDMPERFITTSLSSLEKITVTKNARPPVSGAALTGLISSPGTIEGRVVVLRDPVIPDEPYDILVAEHTDPGWTPLIALAKGVIVEHGGMLSHAAIITRELGIPSIIGVAGATRELKTGMIVRINTQKSSVEILG